MLTMVLPFGVYLAWMYGVSVVGRHRPVGDWCHRTCFPYRQFLDPRSRSACIPHWAPAPDRSVLATTASRSRRDSFRSPGRARNSQGLVCSPGRILAEQSIQNPWDKKGGVGGWPCLESSLREFSERPLVGQGFGSTANDVAGRSARRTRSSWMISGWRFSSKWGPSEHSDGDGSSSACCAGRARARARTIRRGRNLCCVDRCDRGLRDWNADA